MLENLCSIKEFIERHPIISRTTLKQYCKYNPQFRHCRTISLNGYVLKEFATLKFIINSGFLKRIGEKKARIILAKLNKINYIKEEEKQQTKRKNMAHKKKAHSKKVHEKHEEHEMPKHHSKHHDGAKAPMHKAKNARGK